MPLAFFVNWSKSDPLLNGSANKLALLTCVMEIAPHKQATREGGFNLQVQHPQS